jgi:chromosome segregation ATPase
LHAHFQMPAFNLEGKPLSKVITPAIAKKMQDIAGEVFVAHDIHRGKAKAQRIADGDPLNTFIHRSVQQLHADLPRELEAAAAKVEEVKAKIQNYERLIEENQQKLEAGLGDEVKIQKRIAVYEQRIEDMQKQEQDLNEKQRELEEKRCSLAAKEEKLTETQKTVDAGTKTLIKNVNIFKQQKKQFDAEKAAWQTPAMKIGMLFKTAKKAMSSDDEVERLKAEKAELERRAARAVRTEAARWEPALKEARDDARYAEMRRADAEAALRAAEKKLSELEQRMRPDHTYKNDFSGPR